MKKLVVMVAALLLISGCEKKEHKEETKSEAPAKIKITEGVVKKQKAEAKSVDKGEFYYSYQEKKESPKATEDEGRYTKLGAYRHILNNYQKVQISLLANKLSKDFLIYCSACHDDYANGVIGPSLLGKDGEYIYKQLQDFKSGKRKNVLMVQLVRQLSDKKLKAIADEVAAFNKKVQKLLKDSK